MENLCHLCFIPLSREAENQSEEEFPLKSRDTVEKIISKIFGINLEIGEGTCECDPILCIKCDKYLEIAHQMYETVIIAKQSLAKIHPSDEGKFEVVSFEQSPVKNEVKIEDVYDDVVISDVNDESITSTPNKKEKDNHVIVNPRMTKQEAEEETQILQFYDVSCKECPDLEFPSFSSYKTHMRSTHGSKWPFIVCCNTKFEKRYLLLEHLSYHRDPSQFKCPDCGRQFTAKEKIKNHQLRIHGPMEQRKYKCDKCEKCFLKKPSLQIHMMIHLSKEERDAMKTWVCDNCGHGFISKNELERHMEQVHLNKNLYVCDICAKVYKTKSQYKYHCTTAHVTEPQTKVPCEICQKLFKNEARLKDHVRATHTGYGSYVCPVCAKVSKTRRNLNSHMRYMHKSTRQHACTMCEKAFKTAEGLKEHMTTHLGGSLYDCMFCDRTFNSRANMYSHRKKMHPKEVEILRLEKQGVVNK